MTKSVGFIGLGVMGEPMARRLIATGTDLVVWTRSERGRVAFEGTGARVAKSAAQVFEQCDTVILMLANWSVADLVLERGSDGFDVFCKGHTIIQMGTTPPEYSRGLEADILSAGGKYAEIPVSGSSVPAANGELIAMQAGAPETLAQVSDIVAPLFASNIDCGAVPKALQMKLAINTCLPGMVHSLIEATNFARVCGLDLEVFRQVLEAGQLNSPLLRMKLSKLLTEDFSPQATVFQALENMDMMIAAGADAGVAMPVMTTVRDIQRKTQELGFSDQDVIAALRSYEAANSNKE